ncbi:MAG: nicotinate (nicotinamide) nucleotide adenylyltransferase [Bacteroidota bacterium]|nr:nicotinate (nicotinamide) nucleotide adenylyltransferase [Bacteroidota bacterium]
MVIGCLFGTFDPPHRAHVAIAAHMRDHRSLDQVWLVVTPANPFKADQMISPENHRLAMVRLALIKQEGLQASGIELDLSRPNYTVDSLKFLRMRWPQDEFQLIIGSDNFATLHTWKGTEDILDNHKVLVYPRPGFGTHLMTTPFRDHGSIDIVADAPLMDVSSTEIRRAIRDWRPVRDLIDESVLSYIRQHQLYINV